MKSLNFLKKVWDDNIDDIVHLQFQKFSKGEFKNKALISASASKDSYKILTTYEYANEFVRALAEKLGDKKAKVTGIIVSTLNLKENPEFHKILAHCEVKQFMGVKQFKISQEFTGKEITDLLDKFPKAFFALSFSVGEEILKIKPKAPKSGKPGSKGEEVPKIDFCSLKTTDKKIAESFIFENPEFKEAKISHDFLIERIEIPEELKNSEDFALVREKSKRVGKILRKAEIDGKKIIEELELRA